MVSQLKEFELLSINESILREYASNYDFQNYSGPRQVDRTDRREEYEMDFGEVLDEYRIKFKDLKEESLDDLKTIDKKLKLRPYFLKSKKIRDDVGRELFIKSEYSDRWDTYKNTNRVNLSKFLKDMLPYIDKPVVKRLKHGKYFRKVVDGLINDLRGRYQEELLGLTKTANAYAVANPKKVRNLYTGSIIKDLNKSKNFNTEDILNRTKDEEWVKEVLGEEYVEEEADKWDEPRLGRERRIDQPFFYHPQTYHMHFNEIK